MAHTFAFPTRTVQVGPWSALSDLLSTLLVAPATRGDGHPDVWSSVCETMTALGYTACCIARAGTDGAPPTLYSAGHLADLGLDADPAAPRPAWLTCALDGQPPDAADAPARLVEPIETGDGRPGVLAATLPQGAAVSDHDRSLVRLLATAAGLAMRHTDVAERLTRAEETLTAQENHIFQADQAQSLVVLARGLVHDFKNQLFVIMGYCDLLASDLAEDPPLARRIGIVRKAATGALDMTTRLLSLSRTTAAEPQPLDLNAVVLETARLLRGAVGPHIQISTTLADDLPPVRLDRPQCERALVNLVVNARDVLPDGGKIVLRTTTRPADRPGDPLRVLLSVTDNGPGLDAETCRHIFEPFFTTKAEGKGSGLGLATVRRFARDSGGAVDVESSPGRGATFTLSFPAAAGPDTAASADRPNPQIAETVCAGGCFAKPSEGGSHDYRNAVDQDVNRRTFRRGVCRRLEGLPQVAGHRPA